MLSCTKSVWGWFEKSMSKFIQSLDPTTKTAESEVPYLPTSDFGLLFNGTRFLQGIKSEAFLVAIQHWQPFERVLLELEEDLSANLDRIGE